MVVIPSNGEIYFVNFTHFKRKVVYSPANVMTGFFKVFFVIVQRDIVSMLVVVQLVLVVNFTCVSLFI